jgi:ethanolamine ammonia-lyase small subunit
VLLSLERRKQPRHVRQRPDLSRILSDDSKAALGRAAGGTMRAGVADGLSAMASTHALRFSTPCGRSSRAPDGTSRRSVVRQGRVAIR